MKLDAKTIERLALPSGKHDAIYFDSELTGFGLRLRKSGERLRRAWVAQYRSSGRTRRITIGSVEKVGPADARNAARKLLAKVELGGDPQGEKAAKRRQATRTFSSVVTTYLRRGERDAAGDLRVAKLYLTGTYFRPLHAISMSEIAHPDIAGRISAIERAHGPVTASAARRHVSAFFSWAAAEGLLGRNPVNPVTGTRKPAGPRARERVLDDAELAAIWRACGDDAFGRLFGC